MKEKRKRIPAIPLGIIIVDDPLSNTNTPEDKKILNKIYSSDKLKSYKGLSIILHNVPKNLFIHLKLMKK